MKIMEYEESFGPVRFQEGYEAQLAGLSIEEQVRCFALAESGYLTKVPYAELEETVKTIYYYSQTTKPVHDFWTVIVREGIVVGFARSEYAPRSSRIVQVPLLPYQGYVYDSTSDNNGAGYKEQDWYKYLVCLPRDHKLW